MTHSNSFISSADSGRVPASPTMRASSPMRLAVWAAMVALCAAVLLPGGSVSAQGALIHHKVVPEHNVAPPQGRDFWFSMMSNYWGQNLGGKYMRIYITSANNCTAYVQSLVGGAIIPIPVTAKKISSYLIPEFWEVESSGVPENKAIHVWSTTADLTVYDMSHNDYTSDGSYIIPTIGWGTDYVVAAYGSLFEGSGTYVYDLPSTAIVTANQDNTTFTIIPSADLRQCTSGNASGDANSGIVVYPKGSPATFTINRGQCMQFIPVKATDPDNFDMSGTIIHSNQPIGVSGGSVCPNIPADFPYCDHVEEMIPPIRTWAETYYGTNYTQPPGEPNKDFARYLFIASQNNQTIYRTNCASGTDVEAVITNQYGIYWDEVEGPEKFYSNAPFLCVSYINSATYPDNVNGLGDPAECVINPKEQFTKTVVFETPISVGNIVPYTDYANIITRISDEHNTTLDGKPILSIPSQCIDDTFDIRTIPNVAPGTHIVQSDSGVGVYIYGYGFDESYAWAGSFGTGTFHSPDTIAPLVDTTGQCINAMVNVKDSGLLPDGVDKQSGLSEIRVDSVYNMSYTIDPNWVEGSGAPSSSYSMFVVNTSFPAILVVEVYDLAGNMDTVTSYYEPLIDSIKPPLKNLGVWIVGPPNGSPQSVKGLVCDTIYNTGLLPYDITELALLYGNVGFSLWDSTGMNPVDKSPLLPGQRRVIDIQFTATKPTPVVDSIVLSNGCFRETVAVIVSGGANDFLVTSQNWLNKAYPWGPYTENVNIVNLSKDSITVQSGSWSDPHFVALPNQFPIGVPKSPGSVTFNINYTPTASSVSTEDKTQGTWLSSDVLEADGKTPSPRFDSLVGSAIAPSTTFVESIDTTFDCVPGADTVSASFTITATGSNNSTINRVTQTDTTHFFGLTGLVNSSNTPWKPGSQAQTLTPNQTATITVQYIVPDSQNVTFTDSLVAIDGEGDTISGGALYLNVHVIYNAGTTNPPTHQFGPVPYQSNNPALTTSSFSIQNTAEAPLIIDSNGIVPVLNKFERAFTFSLPAGVTLPDTLPANGSLLVTVHFDDSVFNDPLQSVQFNITTNSCSPLSESMTAIVTHPGPSTTTYQPTAILSCENQTNNATITNPGAFTTQPDTTNAFVRVVSIQWSGPDASDFSTTLPVGYTLNGSTNFGTPTNTNGTPNLVPATGLVPILFTPPAQANSVITYNATLTITFINSDSTVSTEVIPVTGIAGGAQIVASSVIANVTPTSTKAGTQQGYASDNLSMPAMVSSSVNNGLTGVTIDQLGVTGVVLTYVIPDRDLLSLTGFSGTGGWTLASTGAANPLVTPGPPGSTSETVTVTLVGALSANTTNFGNLTFQADLDTGTTNTPVQLQSMQLFTGANGTTPVGGCISDSVASSDYTLILACGDETLRDVMEGGTNLSFIGAASPDPVTGGTVTMKFANLGASTLTLAIYDALGNEVARPVNNVYQSAGVWQVTADVSKLPSGTYTYRLSGNSATGPMAVSNQFVVQR